MIGVRKSLFTFQTKMRICKIFRIILVVEFEKNVLIEADTWNMKMQFGKKRKIYPEKIKRNFHGESRIRFIVY
ncbi:hypothetical protein LEP1GSC051_1439 [Leptospira sp. P2653]|nr:hypothetical protein LEP1GSC051_1439 [Leptospira sp. P2653]